MLDPTRRYPEEEENEPPKRRGGGPCTPQGKENSSKNGVTHGCRSHILVLADEKQEDLDALYDRWLRAYQPDSEAALELLEQFVINKWYLLRNERRFNQVEFQLSHFEYTKWDEGQHRIFQLTLRYKTAAERAASKAQHDLEDYFKNRRAEEKHRQQFYARERTTLRQAQKDSERREDRLEKQLQKAEAKGIALPAEKADLAEFRKRNRESFTRLRHELEAAANRPGTEEFLLNGQPSPKQLRNLNILEQSVEITIQDGLAVTTLTPSNQQLLTTRRNNESAAPIRLPPPPLPPRHPRRIRLDHGRSFLPRLPRLRHPAPLARHLARPPRNRSPTPRQSPQPSSRGMLGFRLPCLPAHPSASPNAARARTRFRCTTMMWRSYSDVIRAYFFNRT